MSELSSSVQIIKKKKESRIDILKKSTSHRTASGFYCISVNIWTSAFFILCFHSQSSMLCCMFHTILLTKMVSCHFIFVLTNSCHHFLCNILFFVSLISWVFKKMHYIICFCCVVFTLRCLFLISVFLSLDSTWKFGSFITSEREPVSFGNFSWWSTPYCLSFIFQGIILWYRWFICLQYAYVK